MKPVDDIEKSPDFAKCQDAISDDYQAVRPVNRPILTTPAGNAVATPWHIEETAEGFRTMYGLADSKQRIGIRLAAHSVGLQYQTHYLYRAHKPFQFNMKEYLVNCGFSELDLGNYHL